jgi:hypothetical protein
MAKSANSYYVDFTRGVTPADLTEWEEQMTDAESNRMEDRSRMDIIGATKPPPEQDTATARSDIPRTPIVQWLDLAIVVEEKQ